VVETDPINWQDRKWYNSANEDQLLACLGLLLLWYNIMRLSFSGRKAKEDVETEGNAGGGCCCMGTGGMLLLWVHHIRCRGVLATLMVLHRKLGW